MEVYQNSHVSAHGVIPPVIEEEEGTLQQIQVADDTNASEETHASDVTPDVNEGTTEISNTKQMARVRISTVCFSLLKCSTHDLVLY